MLHVYGQVYPSALPDPEELASSSIHHHGLGVRHCLCPSLQGGLLVWMCYTGTVYVVFSENRTGDTRFDSSINSRKCLQQVIDYQLCSRWKTYPSCHIQADSYIVFPPFHYGCALLSKIEKSWVSNTVCSKFQWFITPYDFHDHTVLYSHEH